MKYLIVNQTYLPDKAATAQYLGDLAEQLVRQGHQVTVLCARRSYMSRNRLYDARDMIEGVSVERVAAPCISERFRFGRMLNAFVTNIALLLRCIRLPDHEHIIACTSPPMLGWFISFVSLLKSSRLTIFVMDLNPDQAFAAGWIAPSGSIARLLVRGWSKALRRAQRIFCLDTSMKERLSAYGVRPEDIQIVDLWWNQINSSEAGQENPFITSNNLQGKFIVLYAGNHSLCHPLHTLLQVAQTLQQANNIHFVFVGGGPRAQEVYEFVEQHQLQNVSQFPYQERTELGDVLRAGNVHVVSLGDKYDGIVHPCKFYSALGVAKKIIIFGPAQSYLRSFANESNDIQYFPHGSVTECADFILHLSQQDEGVRDDAFLEIRDRFSSKQALERLTQSLQHNIL